MAKKRTWLPGSADNPQYSVVKEKHQSGKDIRYWCFYYLSAQRTKPIFKKGYSTGRISFSVFRQCPNFLKIYFFNYLIINTIIAKTAISLSYCLFNPILYWRQELSCRLFALFPGMFIKKEKPKGHTNRKYRCRKQTIFQVFPCKFCYFSNGYRANSCTKIPCQCKKCKHCSSSCRTLPGR